MVEPKSGMCDLASNGVDGAVVNGSHTSGSLGKGERIISMGCCCCFRNEVFRLWRNFRSRLRATPNLAEVERSRVDWLEDCMEGVVFDVIRL